METKRLVVILILVLIAACSSKGTEVLNPQDSASQILYANKAYGFSISLPDGWNIKELAANKMASAAKLYSDPVGTAKTLVLFEKGDTDLLVLADSLRSGESLISYAATRQSGGDKIVSTTIGGNGAVAVDQAAAGELGGKVFVEYLDRTDYILIFHIEIVPAAGDLAKLLTNEFNQIIGNVKTAGSDDGSSSSSGGSSSGQGGTGGTGGAGGVVDECDPADLSANGYYVTSTGWSKDEDAKNKLSQTDYDAFLAEWKAAGWCLVCDVGRDENAFIRSFKTAQEEETFRMNNLDDFIMGMSQKYGLGARDYIAGTNGAAIDAIYDAGACMW